MLPEIVSRDTVDNKQRKISSIFSENHAKSLLIKDYGTIVFSLKQRFVQTRLRAIIM